jgi:Domain of unknown function (DUF4145)
MHRAVDDAVAENDNDGMSKRRVLADYQAMRREFDHATDRAVAILGAAYVEETLLDALLVRLGVKDQNALEQLMENGAPLSTFSNKISLAEAVHLIGPRTRGDLDRIRKVRNECAHSVNPISFTDQRLQALIAALTPRALPIYGSKPELPDASRPRERFQECCHQLYDQFYNDDRLEEFEERNQDCSFGFEMD